MGQLTSESPWVNGARFALVRRGGGGCCGGDWSRPQVAMYRGGDPKQADSFACVTDDKDHDPRDQ
jgi:hypothetical protein